MERCYVFETHERGQVLLLVEQEPLGSHIAVQVNRQVWNSCDRAVAPEEPCFWLAVSAAHMHSAAQS
jgi:hypothetical protein